MDLLSRAIDEMRLHRASYRAVLLEPGSTRTHESAACGIHVVLTGSVTLRQGKSTSVLAAGGLVLLPHSPPHSLEAAGVPGTKRSELLSAELEFEAPDHPLFSVLPPVIHAPAERLRKTPGALMSVQRLAEEVRTGRDGSEALAARLTEVILIEVMRFFTPPPGVECPVGGWFSALRDPVLRRVLTAIHDRPDSDWTVAKLAKIASESRSTFAAHFAGVMREPPMAYLARWRMFRARALLRQTDLSLDAVAEKVGYGSAAAFSLAFTRSHGSTPGAYRRTHSAERTGA